MLKENVYCNQENILNEISIKNSSVSLSQAFDTPISKAFYIPTRIAHELIEHQLRIGLAMSTKQYTKRYLKEIIFFQEKGGIVNNALFGKQYGRFR